MYTKLVSLFSLFVLTFYAYVSVYLIVLKPSTHSVSPVFVAPTPVRNMWLCRQMLNYAQQQADNDCEIKTNKYPFLKTSAMSSLKKGGRLLPYDSCICNRVTDKAKFVIPDDWIRWPGGSFQGFSGSLCKKPRWLPDCSNIWRYGGHMSRLAERATT